MKRIILSLTLGLALTLTMLVLLPPGVFTGIIASGQAADSRIFVNVNIAASGDGSTWDTAYKYLQDALAASEAGDEIWVAQGVYYPDEGDGQTDNAPESTFELISGVSIYGGFIGDDEDSLDDRDWERNVTILSGDLEDDDLSLDEVITPTDSIVGTNAYNVVTSDGVTETARLDGFTITAGKADGSDEHTFGGGMHNSGGSPTLENITFSSNWAQNGGGMYSIDGSPSLTNVTFVSNYAGNFGGGMRCNDDTSTLTRVSFHNNMAGYDGGGMYINFCSATLNHVTFISNRAIDNAGGGIYNYSADPSVLTDVVFSGNVAGTDGGGMHSNMDDILTSVTFGGNVANRHGGGMFSYSEAPILTDVIFNDNWAGDDGGGMHNTTQSNPSLTNVTFSGNQAEDTGGGMYNYSDSNPTLTNVIFSGNQAENGGGMRNDSNCSPFLRNVTFSGNYAAGNGGGIHANTGSNVTLINVTFSGNYADNAGGAVFSYASDPTLINCVLWHNDAADEDEFYYDGSSSPTITYSNIRGVHIGSDNIDEEPYFVARVSADEAPTTEGDYRLLVDSPGIDVGDDSSVTVDFDLDGKRRTVDGDRDGTATVDMGAYEFSPPIYVDHASEALEPDGLTWTRAFTNIQDALSIATPGDEIWVAEGIYYPDDGEGQTDDDPSSTFFIEADIAIYGGFAGGDDDENMDDRDWENNLTILSGDLQDDDAADVIINTDDISGTNAYHVVYGHSGFSELARLDGFIITAGKSDTEGGGMYNEMYSSPTVANIVFSGNYAEGDGGGMYNSSHCHPTVTNVTFRSNYAKGDGGGMYNSNYSNSTVINATFHDNKADNNGGAVLNNYSYPTFFNVLLSSNQATNGGGIYNETGEEDGPVFVNATFSGNQATGNGSAIYNDASNPVIVNSIIWGNQAGGEIQEIHNANGSAPIINYSDMQEGHAGIGNLHQDPQFINPGEGDYRPSPDSPVIDQGNNASLTETITTDLDGNPRIVDGDEIEGAVVDMGAYESQTTLVNHSLTVNLAGSGSGSVSSIPEGITCPGDCGHDYPAGSMITLTATSSVSSTFSGWSGACTGGESSCQIILNTNEIVTATFALVSESKIIYLPLIQR